MNDFTSWTPDTWHRVAYDEIPFPTDPIFTIASERTYMAVAMLLWYDGDLRALHARAWDGLNAAWKATFHSELTAAALEKWPVDGPHGFNETQSTWLASTLRYLKQQGRQPARRRASRAPPPPPPAPAPAAKAAARSSRRSDNGGGASRAARSPDPVQSSGRFVTVHILILYHLFHLYPLLQH